VLVTYVAGDCSGLQQLFEFFRQTVVHSQHHRVTDASAVVGRSPTTVSATHRGGDEADWADSGGGEDARPAAAAAATRAEHELSSSDRNVAQPMPVHCGSRRRRRVLFSREQTVALEEWFGRHSYVSAADRDRLATSLALRPSQVKIWFQNRRYKLKKIRRQVERNRDRMMASSTAAAAAAAAAQSLHFSHVEFNAHSADVGHRRALVQPSVVRRIAVPILVRDGRPCCGNQIRHSDC